MKNRNLNHSDDWMTPPDFYKNLDDIYHFDFDPCPFQHNTEKWDGLKIAWGKMNFVNPPYSLALKTAFVKKAIFEFTNFRRKSVLLLPVATGGKLFQDHIYHKFDFELLPGRINFIGYNRDGKRVNFHLIDEPTDLKSTGQHDSMLVFIL